MQPDVFSHHRLFKQTFNDGLHELLKQPDLGCFILVCANAFADAELYAQMFPAIQQQFTLLRRALEDGGLETGVITATSDDREIFDAIVEQGIDTIPVVQYRQVGDWRCQFNHLRTFRPTRMAAKKDISLQQEFDPSGFHFNRGFMQKERLWEGEWLGKAVSWYYNKFPFARYHGLLVPEKSQQHPQYLTSDMHNYIWRLVEASAAVLPGLGLAYNSLGAFASVNHLHFQWFIEPNGLPIMSPHWRHNGGSKDYPLACYKYKDAKAAWHGINRCHDQSISYNLIYNTSGLYLCPRLIQSQITHHGWTSGFSWIELAGEIVMQNVAAFTELGAGDIEQEMKKLRLNGSELLM